MFRWLFRKTPLPPPSAEDLYFDRMKSLVWMRREALVCTGSDDPKLPHYFNPPDGADLNEAFREHLERLWERWLPETTELHFCTTAIVAAGLLSYGKLPMAAYILDHLPDREHRNGYCLSFGRRALAALLPLPVELRNPYQWVTGSPEADAVRSWFAKHEAQLEWEPSSGTFVLPASS